MVTGQKGSWRHIDGGIFGDSFSYKPSKYLDRSRGDPDTASGVMCTTAVRRRNRDREKLDESREVSAGSCYYT